MTDSWVSDDKKLRDLFKYQLRSHVSHQDGRDSLAPTLVFADADCEVGDGTCGLHADAKSANEPAIIYARADSLIDALAERDRYKARAERAEGALRPFARFIDKETCEVTIVWRDGDYKSTYSNVLKPCDFFEAKATLAQIDAPTTQSEVTND